MRVPAIHRCLPAGVKQLQAAELSQLRFYMASQDVRDIDTADADKVAGVPYENAFELYPWQLEKNTAVAEALFDVYGPEVAMSQDEPWTRSQVSLSTAILPWASKSQKFD